MRGAGVGLTAAAALVAAAAATVPSAASERVEEGARLYAENCAACHGANLEGQPNWRVQNTDGSFPAPPHDDEGHTWHHPDRMLLEYTRLGGDEMLRRMGVTGVKSGMPAFGDVLSDEDIALILEFLKSRWSPRAREYQRAVTEAEE